MKVGTPEHPKMKKLARLLNAPIGVAVGAMESLWHWTARFCPRGDAGKYDDEEIADACAVGIAADVIVPALVNAGWIDRADLDPAVRLVVHDWPHHCNDSVHMAMARAGECFADGSVPKLTRLSGDERKAAESHYAAILESRAHAVHTPNAQDAASVSTALAKPKPKPSLSQAEPEPEPKPSQAEECAAVAAAPAPTSSVGSKSNSIKTDSDLLAGIDAWNSLPRELRGPNVDRDAPNQATVKAWVRRGRNPELRKLTEDFEALMNAVRDASFLHGKGFFTFAWLFGTGQSGEWNAEKLLNGAYREHLRLSSAANAAGNGSTRVRDPDAEATAALLRSRTTVVDGAAAGSNLGAPPPEA